MKKIFKDRYNHLNSQLKSAKSVKLDKIVNNCLIARIEGQLLELKDIELRLKRKGYWQE